MANGTKALFEGKDTHLFDESWAAVRQLSEHFETNHGHYISSNYQEAEVRKDFIDKFFKALGWDVDHEEQSDPWRQEVKIEKSDSKSRGRADYAFSIAPHYGRIQFLVEAKRPLLSITTPDNCFQVIRYSWPKGLPVAVLTDFQALHIIDTRFRPNINSATSRVVRSWTYKDYRDRDKYLEIYWLLSREAVSEGSIGNFAISELPSPDVATKQYTLFPGEAREFDDDFLARLDEWREALAQSFKKARENLNSEQLTESVQRTLDRMVFIRFLEDKLIEPNKIIEAFGGTGATFWKDFISTCRRLDQTYNGIVFKPHPILDDPEFAPAGSVFADLCDEITDPHSPYNFDSIPIEILGRIYERFLGRIVLSHKKTAEVVEKPDVRKAGGVYYTPDYIVSFMVEQSLGAILDGKKPDAIMKLRLIDTACGSGSFLIGAFSYLTQAILNYWRKHPGAAKKGILEERDGEQHLSLKYKREILVSCIFGVDIDAQAVEVAQLSLYLKLLDEETTYSAQQQQIEMGAALLPSLSSNLVVGNSLVNLDEFNQDMFSLELLRQTKSLDFKKTFSEAFKTGGFDLVIGNPPYIKEYTNKDAFEHVRSSPYYEGKMDIWYLFACRALDLLKKGGLLAYIATNNWVTNSGAKKLRSKISSECQIEKLIDFGDYKVFRDAGIQTMILIVRNDSNHGEYDFDYRKLVGVHRQLDDARALLEGRESAGCTYLTPRVLRSRTPSAPFTFAGVAIDEVLEKIEAHRNFSLNGDSEIAQGIVPNPDVVTKRSLSLIPEKRRNRLAISPGQGVFVVDEDYFLNPNDAERMFLKPLFEPSDVDRYAIAEPARKRIIYSTRENTRNVRLPNRFIEHLEKFREIMEQRRENKKGMLKYYQLHWPRDESFFRRGAKILAVRKCAQPTFVYVEEEAYVMMSFNVIRTDRVNLLYLTALLNSEVVRFWLKHKGKMQGENYQIDKEPLLAIPLYVPSESQQQEIAQIVRRISECIREVRSATTEAYSQQLHRLLQSYQLDIDERIAGFYDVQLDTIRAVNLPAE